MTKFKTKLLLTLVAAFLPFWFVAMCLLGSKAIADGKQVLNLLVLLEQAAPAVSNAGTATMYADSTSHTVQMSVNGGAFADVSWVRSTKEFYQDLTAGTPVNLNVTGMTGCKTIELAYFWISVNGADVGANTSSLVNIQIFSSDTFKHGAYNTTGISALLYNSGEFTFESEDLKAAVNTAAVAIDIDAVTNFTANMQLRIYDGTDYEYVRMTGPATDADTIPVTAISRATGDPVWQINDDVETVLEVTNLAYNDADGTGELHIRFEPNAATANCRIHGYVIYNNR